MILVPGSHGSFGLRKSLEYSIYIDVISKMCLCKVTLLYSSLHIYMQTFIHQIEVFKAIVILGSMLTLMCSDEGMVLIYIRTRALGLNVIFG